MTKEKTEEVSRFLSSRGIACRPYHAGLGKKVKAEVFRKLPEWLTKLNYGNYCLWYGN